MFDSEDRDAWQKPSEVLAAMEIGQGMTVADIGAGTGYFLSHLSAAVGDSGKVLALDVEESMVDFMKARAQRERLANVEPRAIPFDDPGLDIESVDRVLIVNTWHHIDQRTDYTRKLAGALRPEGRVYIVDFTKESAHGPPPEQRLSSDEVIAELEAGGLSAAAVDEDLPDQYIVVARLRP
jgi:ubiquinone/menaquinone biosynthesis C-methylase UbiE